jgi:hypothetical protein
VTSRVFACRSNEFDPERIVPPRTPRPALKGFSVAALVAMLLIPLAGAAEAPAGWIVAAGAALATLLVARLVGRWLPWGLVTVLSAVAAIVVPRGELSVIGPALLVVTGLCVVFWLINRADEQADGRPGPGSPERRAQLLMGMSGERQVGQVLGRELPDEYVLINGLKLPRGAGDIDHLVVGPTGVFLLES